MVSIRVATDADREAIYAIHTASIQNLGSTEYSMAQIDAWDSYPSPDSYDIGDETMPFLVAEIGDELAGFAQLDLDAAELDKLYVHPDHARCGVGTALMKRVETTAADAGLGTLEIAASLNAVPFYGAMGYEIQDGVMKTLQGIEFPCAVMDKPLR